MPLRPPPPNPPLPVCGAHRIASRGPCPECVREYRNEGRFVLGVLVVLVVAIAGLVAEAIG
jgi:hypothetical protein